MREQAPKNVVFLFTSALGVWLFVWVLLLAGLDVSPGTRIALGTAAAMLTLAGSAFLLHFLINRFAGNIRRTQATLAESLDLFDLTLSTLEEGVLVLGPEDGAIIRGNATVEKMFGYSLAELTGRNTRMMHADDEAFARFEEQMKITTGNMSFFRLECDMRRKNGERFPAELFVRPNRKRGGPFCVVYVIRDLTQKRRAEAEAARIQRMESIGIMAGGIAHDFNNMLSAVLGNITLAKRHLKPGDKALDALSDSESAALKAKTLTQQLLTFTKGGEPERRVIHLEETLRQMAELTLRGSGVSSIVRLAPGLWPVEVDVGQISQVVNNIVLNAVQAMPGGGSLEIDAENFVIEPSPALPLREGRWVKVSFRDTGTGIPPENLPRIFDPYFTTKPDGSGLGLAITYSIIQKHGGRIEVESGPGAGSVFTLFLPVKGGPARKNWSGSDELHPGTGRVLVLDDEAIVRTAAREMIQALGYQVELARTGDEAVEMCRRAMEELVPFDVVLVDLTLPEEPGARAVIRRLLDTDSRMRIIVSSGYPDDRVMVHFQDHDCRGIVVKPYTSVNLSRVLHQALTGAAQA